ncbi:hypothetical protein [Halobacillus naozhouensis]|uniref:DUF1641 domain-containing protein n=1 Tax=Halobacillus naozhouensis TaxID=554880 RepID=A0ABY8J180_9BACI|nr:hypothetical protein [Halobacillus naozhouensis]WFT76245.1 hypothetical protein P9989_07745 [Halobacillus naozhouensis]
MSTTVTLKVKGEAGDIQKQQNEIEAINLLQFEQTMKVIKDVFVQVQEDEGLKQLFANIFKEEQKPEGEEKDEESQEDDEDAQFIMNLIDSFDTIAVHLPAKAVHLLSVLSDIEINTLQKQKMLDVMDIYDAVIEENDLERLWKRAKKSLATTKAKMAFVNLRKKATSKNSAEKTQA